MAIVYANVQRKVAKMPGVRVAVRAERDVLAGLAKAFFAEHDNPGGHKITTRNGRTDAFVNLDGPAPLSLEMGHFARQSADGGIPAYVNGIHVLGRAIAAETL